MLMGPCAVTEASPQACASPRGNHEFSIIERLIPRSAQARSVCSGDARFTARSAPSCTKPPCESFANARLPRQETSGTAPFTRKRPLLMESDSLASGLVNEARHLFGSRQQVLARYGHTR